MNNDPREILMRSPMGRFQIVAVGLCVLLNAIDGFDVLSISFASPGIAAEWGIDRAALGLVLSMELIGMAVGSVVIGRFADIFGRRPIILSCLFVMATGMALASTAQSVAILASFRFLTGLGIGGMLASTNAMVAEYSNAKNRNLAVIIMAAGYPMGAIIGGSIASSLLEAFDWRSVFVFGAVVTIVFVPVIYTMLPESIEFLVERRPRNALDRVNRTMKRMGHAAVSDLPAKVESNEQTKKASLFSSTYFRTTILLTIAYFAHIMTFYFILKWIPKIVVDMGFPAPEAGGVLVWANVGGAMGAVLLGLLTQKFGVRGLVLGVLVFAFGLVTYFGRGFNTLNELSLVAAAAGFFTNAGVVGLYALFAQSFPTELRASGTGFVIGVGRGGAALGPIVAGYLFEAGQGLQTVAIIMAAGSLIAAVALLMLKPKAAPAAAAS